MVPPMGLRPRGPTRTVSPAKRRAVVKDPFSNCSYCNKNLAGFVSPNVAGSNEMVILLHCGHVLCKDCIIKQAEMLNTSTISDKLHARTHVTCTKCKSVGFFHFLPSLKELRGVSKCDYEGCNLASPESVYCNICKVNLCSKCRFKHDGKTTGHTLTPSIGPSSQFTKKFLTCTRHTAITATHICNGCGDATCEQCNGTYEDSKKSKHECRRLGEMQPDVEQYMHTAGVVQQRFGDILTGNQMKKAQFDKKMELLKNELCKHAYYMVNAIIGRTLQLLGVLAKEGDQMNEHFKLIENICTDAVRRIDVSVEMDERVRDRSTIPSDDTALLFQEIAQSVFRPALQQLSRTHRLIAEAEFDRHFVEISKISTNDIVSEICKWGSNISSTTSKIQPAKRESELQPYDRQKPFDGIPRAFPEHPTPSILTTHMVSKSGDKAKDTFYLETFRKLWIASQNPSKGVHGELISGLRVIPWAANAQPEKTGQVPDEQRPTTSGMQMQQPRQPPQAAGRGMVIPSTVADPRDPRFGQPNSMGPKAASHIPPPNMMMHSDPATDLWMRRLGFIPASSNRTMRLPPPNLRPFLGAMPVNKEEADRMGKCYAGLRQLPQFARNDPKLLQALSLLMARFGLTVPILPGNLMVRLTLEDPPPIPPGMMIPPIAAGSPIMIPPHGYPPMNPNNFPRPPQPNQVHPLPGYTQPSTSAASGSNNQNDEQGQSSPEPVTAQSLMGNISPQINGNMRDSAEETNEAEDTPVKEKKPAIRVEESSSSNKDTSTDSNQSNPPESASPKQPNGANSNVTTNSSTSQSEKQPPQHGERIVLKLPRPHDNRPEPPSSGNSNQKESSGQVHSHVYLNVPMPTTSKHARSESPRSESAIDDTMSERSIDKDDYHKYCFVCNDIGASEAEDKGMCATCPRVYHARCHMPPIKRKWEDIPEDWKCTMCEDIDVHNLNPSLKNANTRKLCHKVILSCYEHVVGVRWFTSPVPANTPYYREYVKEPIDLGTIVQRISRHHSDPIPNVSEFIRLMNLVFSNCSSYNPKGTNTEKAGRKVWKSYSNAVKKYLPDLKTKVWLYVTLFEDKHPPQGTPTPLSTSRKRRPDESSDDSGDQMKKPKKSSNSESEPVRLSAAGAPPTIKHPAMLAASRATTFDIRHSRSPSIQRASKNTS